MQGSGPTGAGLSLERLCTPALPHRPRLDRRPAAALQALPLPPWPFRPFPGTVSNSRGVSHPLRPPHTSAKGARLFMVFSQPWRFGWVLSLAADQCLPVT